ncbi:MAG: pseudouridine synthase [Pseudomonadota bacterium]
MSRPAELPSGWPYCPPRAPLALRHVDPELVLVDKPSGLLSVPGKAPGLEDCLEARVRHAYPDARLVHRLDMDTSGVMVFARSALAQRHLGWQFERRQIEKSYVARVWGHPGAPSGRIDLPLCADWPRRPLQMVCHLRGKPAVTRWELIAAEGATSRLRLRPETGRSHQLRVHLRELGHPILGDRFYAGGRALAAAPRLALHAESLRFRHPVGGAWLTVTAPVPF